MPMLRLILSNAEYRDFFNVTMLRKTLRRTAELWAKQTFPAWLSRWLLKRFYRVRDSSSQSAARSSE